MLLEKDSSTGTGPARTRGACTSSSSSAWSSTATRSPDSSRATCRSCSRRSRHGAGWAPSSVRTRGRPGRRRRVADGRRPSQCCAASTRWSAGGASRQSSSAATRSVRSSPYVSPTVAPRGTAVPRGTRTRAWRDRRTRARRSGTAPWSAPAHASSRSSGGSPLERGSGRRRAAGRRRRARCGRDLDGRGRRDGRRPPARRPGRAQHDRDRARRAARPAPRRSTSAPPLAQAGPRRNVLIGGGWAARLVQRAAWSTSTHGHSCASTRWRETAWTAAHVVPAVGALAVVRAWSGVAPVTADQLPLLGAIPRRPGLFVAAGGPGFTLGAGPLPPRRRDSSSAAAGRRFRSTTTGRNATPTSRSCDDEDRRRCRAARGVHDRRRRKGDAGVPGSRSPRCCSPAASRAFRAAEAGPSWALLQHGRLLRVRRRGRRENSARCMTAARPAMTVRTGAPERD